MKRALQIAFFVVILSYSVAQCEELGLYIGYFKGKGTNAEYNLTFNFGIEQWENEKLSTFRHQKWFLDCSYPDPLTRKPNTSCSLERTIIDNWGKTSPGVVIGTRNHNTLDGTLKLLDAQWQRGKLDFNIVLDDNSTIEVMLRMKLKDGSIYLDSFKAISIARGILSNSMSSIEYKIPKYTYILNVPFEMIGLRSMDAKKWDDMIASLSKQDQASWDKFKTTSAQKCRALDKTTDEQVLKKIIPNYERRKSELDKGAELTPEEKNKVADYFAEEFAKCLANSGISKNGQKKIVDSLKQSFMSEK